MILCVQIEKLGSQLSKLTLLMDKYQREEPNFADDALEWLEESEKAMSILRLPEGSEMSALRGRIMKAAHVSSTKEGHSTRKVQRQARDIAAADSLERAEAIMRGRLHSSEERLQFFEEKLCEGITALMLQTPLPEKTLPNMERLKRVWGLLRQEKSTRPLSLYLAASLSPSDRSFILDRVLNRVYNEELGQLPSSDSTQ